MKKFILPTLIISLVASPTSWAKGGQHENSDWARVTKVQPIVQRVEHRSPQETCWEEPVRQSSHRHTSQSYNNNSQVGTIVGGIIGGVVGRQVGRNKGNKNFGTVLGAVVGATVGNGLSNQHNSTSKHRSPPRNERYCEVVDRVSYQEKVVGYDVWYRYQGQQYQTRMDHRPGHKIKVRVSVRPY